MSDDKDHMASEVVIVRRRKGSGEEGHHGGAWKIAYADFMTAMMAFFLVMWLVNMTDDKTIVQIANYFNPIQLTDRSPSQKGLHDSDPMALGKSPKASAGPEESVEKKLPPNPGRERMEKARQERSAADETKLFLDPMKLLDDVAADADLDPQAGERGPLSGAVDDRSAMPQQPEPRLFDPFDPRAARGKADARASDPQQASRQNADGPSVPPAAAPAETPSQSGQDAASPQPGPAPHEAGALTAMVRATLMTAVAGLDGARPAVSVEETSEGVLVSIMDGDDFEMFRRGSAEPLPETLAVITRLGDVIRHAQGKVVVRGHTDARTFRRSTYDNWRLSTARAHMAHYMLRRAGIPDARIEKIEGFADSHLRLPGDPFAAANRRIEYLIRRPQP